MLTNWEKEYIQNYTGRKVESLNELSASDRAGLELVIDLALGRTKDYNSFSLAFYEELIDLREKINQSFKNETIKEGNKMKLFEQLTKLANDLDAKGLHAEADLIDQILVEATQMDPMSALKSKQMKDPTTGNTISAYQHLKNMGMKDIDMPSAVSKMYGNTNPATWNMDLLTKDLMSKNDKLKTVPLVQLKDVGEHPVK